MSDRKAKSITAMLNAWPASTGDLKLRLMTYLRAVDDFSDGAVAEASRRYTFGEDGRSSEDRRFPPTVPQFREMAESVENQIRLKERPPIAAPVQIKRTAAWHKMQAKVQAAIAEYRRTYAEALKENPSLDYFDHVRAEYKRNTGRSFDIPKPKPQDPAVLVAKHDAVFADELARVREKHFKAGGAQ
jgi:hypothetical protein